MEKQPSVHVQGSIPSASLVRYLEVEAILKEFFDCLDFCRLSAQNGLCENYCCSETVPGHYRFSENVGIKELDAARVVLYEDNAKTNWQEKPNGSCKHCSKGGCIFKTHKLPICISYLCTAGQAFLWQNNVDYDPREIEFKLISILDGTMEEKDYLAFKLGLENLRGVILKVGGPEEIKKPKNHD